MTTPADLIPLEPYPEYSEEEMLHRAATFRETMLRRRSVRQFSERIPPRSVIEECIRVAASAPSGANMQPWHFAVVQDAGVKRRIREAAEVEERKLYDGRASHEWLQALAPLGTDADKPFLEIAPYLIVVFVRRYGKAEGAKVKHYYVQESVGIATGMLITALHHVGLATLTHTPSPMGFLNEILARPDNENPFVVLVTGYPAREALVPKLKKKPLSEVCKFV